MRHLFWVASILVVATCGWFMLAATLGERTAASDSAQRAALAGIWGRPQNQHPALFEIQDGKNRSVALPEKTDVAVDLALERRQKGLLWYQTYTVSFAARYAIRGGVRPEYVHVVLPYGAQDTTYRDVFVLLNGHAIPFSSLNGQLEATAVLPARALATIRLGLRSDGLDTWTYTFGGLSDVRNFSLKIATNTPEIDFPPGTLAPTEEYGTQYAWRYSDLVTGKGIGVAFSDPMQPGPLAQRLTLWAPLALGFYFFVLLVITTLRGIDLHPMSYLFLAASFFAFHLLFAYTIDRITIVEAFVIASVVSVALTISYLRLVVGLRFAAVEAGLAQFFYLILFSLALFNEGYSGLSITIGAIVTLFLMQQWTARLDWNAVFGGKRTTTPGSTKAAPTTNATS